MIRFRFGIRTLAALTLAAGIFFLGYRLGWERGRSGQDDSLDRVIWETLGNEQWVSLGESQSIGGGISVLTSEGCAYYDVDGDGNLIAERSNDRESLESENPFGDSDDPFQ